MNTVTLIGALYVTIPAVLALLACMVATYWTTTITLEEDDTMVDVIYGQLATLYRARASVAVNSASYWGRAGEGGAQRRRAL